MNYKKSKVQEKKEIERFNKIAKMKQQSYTDEQIAEALDVSSVTVKNTFRKFATAVPDKLIEMGMDPSDVKHAWVKNDDISAFHINPLYNPEEIDKITDKIVGTVGQHAPVYKLWKRPKVKDGHLLIFNVSDLHIGGGHGTKLSVDRFNAALEEVMAMSDYYNIDKIIFVGGNDVIQIDTPAGTTTRGTNVDTDGTEWHEMFDAAVQLYVDTLEKLLSIADVHYVHIPSNHEETLGFTISRVVETWFRSSKNITFDVNTETRKYVKYGDNLIAFLHGHKMKEASIPITIAHEAGELWGQTKRRYVYLGHYHHYNKIKFADGKDYTGISMEYLRTASDPNDWARGQGFMSTPGVNTFLHHKTEGQVAKFTKNFDFGNS